MDSDLNFGQIYQGALTSGTPPLGPGSGHSSHWTGNNPQVLSVHHKVSDTRIPSVSSKSTGLSLGEKHAETTWQVKYSTVSDSGIVVEKEGCNMN